MKKIFLVFLSLFLFACSSEVELTQNNTYCLASQRNVDFCTAEFAPVCGWFNEDIKCIKYPCADVYSNSCAACKDEKVLYYTDGECPK